MTLSADPTVRCNDSTVLRERALAERGKITTAAVSHPPSGQSYWADSTQFGILGREKPLSMPANRLVDINADDPLHRGFVGAQLAADPDFRVQFISRVESHATLIGLVARHRIAD